jgi:hypothetical protein
MAWSGVAVIESKLMADGLRPCMIDKSGFFPRLPRINDEGQSLLSVLM